MNSPFTREEQAFARATERIARNIETLATAIERNNELMAQLLERLNNETK